MKIFSRWRVLTPYLREHRWPILVGLGFVVISTALDQIAPWMIKQIIDKLQDGNSVSDILPQILIMLGSICISAVLLYYQRLWVIQASRKIEYRLRNDLFASLQNQPKVFFDHNKIGDIMSRITNDLDRIRDFLGPVILHLARMLCMVVFTIFSVFLLSPKLALMGIIPVFIVPFFVNRFMKKMHQLHGRIQKDLGQMNDFVQDTISGIQVLKSYGAEKVFTQKFENSSEKLKKDGTDIAIFTSGLWPFIGLLGSVGILLVIWYGSKLTIETGLTLGTLSACLIYLLRLQFPLAGLGWVSNLYQRSNASMDRIISLKQNFLKPEVPYSETIQPPFESGNIPEFHHCLEIKKLTFSYTKGIEVLKDISVTIPKGSSLGIVGPTGSGKTTLLHLICGVYEAPKNTLYIDQKPAESFSDLEWKQIFSLASQDGFLFSDTIENNIQLGQTKRSTDSIERAAELSGFAKDIPQIESGYGALLGERGINLSGGQRQRVGLARALLANSEIICLDDTLSALDTETEKEVLDNIRNHLTHKTLIITSHRYSAIAHCHHILFLDEGKIVEQGNHAELMKLHGRYFQVYQQQALSTDLERA